MRNRLSGRGVVTLLLGLLMSQACQQARQEPATLTAVDAPELSYTSESRLLDETFRIDIETIRLSLVYDPAQRVVRGRALLDFRMRPGQRRPLFHFDPAVRGQVIGQLRLDGETWTPPDSSVLRVVEFRGTTQQALELQRDIFDTESHQIEVVYAISLPAGYPRFSSEVNDLEGRGNEEIFPTINSPEELARHQITFRVESSTPFRLVGSGRVERGPNPSPQEWSLDTERPVASYTVMFALLPAADTVYQERTIAGIPVRVIAFSGGSDPAQALGQLESWLPDLARNLGPFPMPRGLSVFLVQEGGGMEYFGGTISSLGALRHEVFHMYFGCSTIARTYRDSWWDEAINSWYTDRRSSIPIPDGFRSNMVSGRAPIATGFDRRAYLEGGQIIEAMAQRAGGRDALIRFLSWLHRNHSFEPFGTLDLAGHYREFTGIDMRAQFLEWLYQGTAPAPLASQAASVAHLPPDPTPPAAILERYGLR